MSAMGRLSISMLLLLAPVSAGRDDPKPLIRMAIPAAANANPSGGRVKSFILVRFGNRGAADFSARANDFGPFRISWEKYPAEIDQA